MRELLATIRNANHNFVINGAMDLAQRIGQGSGASGFTSGYFVDRFKIVQDQDGVPFTFGMNQSTDVPTQEESGFPFQYSLNCGNQAAVASLVGDEYWAFQYQFEGYDSNNFFGKRISLGFWMKSDIAGTFAVSFGQRDNSSNFATLARGFTYDQAGVWQYIKIEDVYIDPTVNPNSPDRLQADAFRFEIVWAAGPNRTNLPADVWNDTTGGFLSRGVAGMTNGLGISSTDFWVTGVQLNIGKKVAPFQRCGINFTQEVALCQRYYEKSYELGVAPGSSTSNGRESYQTSGSVFYRYPVQFRTTKRGIGTPTVYGHQSGAAGVSQRDGGTAVGLGSFSTGDKGFTAQGNAHQTNVEYSFQWTLDAEL